MRFGHSGDLGDIIYACPVIRALGGGDLILTRGPGVREPMTSSKARSIGSLLETQHYIHSVRMGIPAEVEGNFDEFRTLYRARMTVPNLADCQLELFALPIVERDTPWIAVEPNPVAKYVFARTVRYNNAKFPWATLPRRDAVFVGTQEEHVIFEHQFGPVKFYGTPNILALAEVIRGSEMFYGNQSLPLALAIGMGARATIEESIQFPDCHYPHPNLRYV